MSIEERRLAILVETLQGAVQALSHSLAVALDSKEQIAGENAELKKQLGPKPESPGQ